MVLLMSTVCVCEYDASAVYPLLAVPLMRLTQKFLQRKKTVKTAATVSTFFFTVF